MEDNELIKEVTEEMKEYMNKRRDEEIKELLGIELPKEEKPVVLGESWLTDGNCKTCRRKKYCSKQCKANSNREKSMLTSMIFGAALRTMFKKKE